MHEVQARDAEDVAPNIAVPPVDYAKGSSLVEHTKPFTEV